MNLPFRSPRFLRSFWILFIFAAISTALGMNGASLPETESGVKFEVDSSGQSIDEVEQGHWQNQDEESAAENLRIVGGTPAQKNDFPFMAYVDNNGYVCGGVIINPYYIVTAAHCMFGPKQYHQYVVEAVPIDVTVIVGTTDVSSPDPSNTYTVKSITLHHNYDFDSNQIDYDVALIELCDKLPISNSGPMNKITLAKQSQTIQNTVIVAGWGNTTPQGPDKNKDDFQSQSQQQMKLRKVSLQYLEQDTCQQFFSNYTGANQKEIRGINVTRRNVCTLTTNKDTCVGDTGGPMVCFEKAGSGKNNNVLTNNAISQAINPSGQRPLLCGIVSYGFGCAAPMIPTIYTNFQDTGVNSISSWIATNSREQSKGDASSCKFNDRRK